MREHIYKIIEERWLRIQIYYMQIAITLGYKKYNDGYIMN